VAIVQGAITIVLFLAILVVLVLVHEIGHFVVARLAGIRVHEFGIGFPPKARDLGRRGDTLYTLNWLPIGGFVRMEGEDGDSTDPRSFTMQPLVTKLVVLVAGVAMNLLLAFVLFTGIALVASPQAQLVIGEVQAGGPAAAAGLVAGDAIVAVDGQTFDYLPPQPSLLAATGELRARAGDTVVLEVLRADGRQESVTATLRPAEELEEGALGIQVAAFGASGAYAGHDLATALALGAEWTVDAFGMILDGLGTFVGSLVSDPTGAPPVSGPVGIAATVGNVFWNPDLGPVYLAYLVALLSANLALVNILPIPALDGGRMLIISLKAGLGAGSRLLRRLGFNVQGPSAERAVAAERMAYLVGFVLLFAFLAWVTVFDIARQVGGG
jgi:regulator of sigma E protease